MPPLLHVSTVFVACLAAVAWAPPAVADPMDPIPGNGVFRVGIDIAPGLYHTGGSGSVVWGLDKRCADPGVNVLVVYLQHT